ncbi:MAG: sensor histidine kinase [Flavobacteriales bacterium]|nr:sensor histidine kinase [Flavobacteriales bacterium]
MSNERERRRKDTLLSGAIVAVLIVSGMVMYLGWHYLEKRSRELQLDKLDQGMARAEAGLMAYVQRIHDRLALEIELLSPPLPADDPSTLQRWAGLLRSDWAGLEVRLATEQGDELALIREDSAFRVERIVHLNTRAVTLLQRMELTGDLLPDVDTLPLARDPRTRPWFSEAMQNSRIDPVWNIPRNVKQGELLVAHISMLIRPRAAGLPLRVLEFGLLPELSGQAVFGGNTAPDMMNILLIGPGHPIVQPIANVEHPVHAVLEKALDAWGGQRRKVSVEVHHGEAHYLCHFKPVALNGETFFLGTILPMENIPAVLVQGRFIVVAAVLIQVVLVALLVWLFRRKRGDLQRLREQQKRSKQQQRKLAKALEERDVLDREVHHRVKNNLQVVSSLLSLQAGRLEEGPVRSEFMRGKRRIDNMALVHHKLYGMTDLRGIDLQKFFDELANAISALHEPHSASISCEVNAGGLKADPDTTIALGQILCELLTNCYQHAFPYSTGGHIDVMLRREETTLHRLVVKDNGRGMSPKSRDDQGRLGLEITEALASQLDGSFRAYTDGGVTFEVLFRMEPLT